MARVLRGCATGSPSSVSGTITSSFALTGSTLSSRPVMAEFWHVKWVANWKAKAKAKGWPVKLLPCSRGRARSQSVLVWLTVVVEIS